MSHELQTAYTAVKTFSRYVEDKSLVASYLDTSLCPKFSLEPTQRKNLVRGGALGLTYIRLISRLYNVVPSDQLLHQAIITGAAMGPYDAMQDTGCVDSVALFNTKFTDFVTSAPRTPSPLFSDPLLNMFAQSLDTHIPRDQFPGYWKTLQAVHGVQIATIAQNTHLDLSQKISLSYDNLLFLTRYKGGLTVLLMASLVDTSLTDSIQPPTMPPTGLPSPQFLHELQSNPILTAPSVAAQSLFYSGELIQQCDNYGDAIDDDRAGIITEATMQPQSLLKASQRMRAGNLQLRDQLTSAGFEHHNVDIYCSYLIVFAMRMLLKRTTKSLRPQKKHLAV